MFSKIYSTVSTVSCYLLIHGFVILLCLLEKLFQTSRWHIFSNENHLQWEEATSWNYDFTNKEQCINKHLPLISGLSVNICCRVWDLPWPGSPLYQPSTCEISRYSHAPNESGYQIQPSLSPEHVRNIKKNQIFTLKCWIIWWHFHWLLSAWVAEVF